MGHLRRSLHWLCCITLVLTGVFGRGFVLCIDGGSVRLEALGIDGSCYQGRGKLSDHVALLTSIHSDDRCEPGGGGVPGTGCEPSFGREPCDGCEDVTVLAGAAPLPAGSAASLLPAPALLLDFISLGAVSSIQSADLVQRTHPSLLDPRSLDLYAVRKTVVLLI